MAGVSSDININVKANVKGATSQINAAGDAVRDFGKRTQTANQNVKVFGKNLTGAGGANKFLRSGLQQTGYQLGDFAVQVGGGTNALQAFGQQAPQLLQIFGPLGSIIGAAVAIFAAVGVAIMKTTDSIKESKDEIKTLTESTDRIKASASALAATYNLELVEGLEAAKNEFGELDAEMRKVLESNRQLKNEKLLIDISEQADKLKSQIPALVNFFKLTKEIEDSKVTLAKIKIGRESDADIAADITTTISNLSKELAELPPQAKGAAGSIKTLSSALKNADFDKAIETINVLVEQLEAFGDETNIQRIALIEQAIALRKVIKENSNLEASTKKLIKSTYDIDLEISKLQNVYGGLIEKSSALKTANLLLEGSNKSLLSSVASFVERLNAQGASMETITYLAQGYIDLLKEIDSLQGNAALQGIKGEIDGAKRLNTLLRQGNTELEAKRQLALEIEDPTKRSTALAKLELAAQQKITQALLKRPKLENMRGLGTGAIPIPQASPVTQDYLKALGKIDLQITQITEKQRLMNALGLSENVAQQAAKIATTLKLTDEQFALLVQRLKKLEDSPQEQGYLKALGKINLQIAEITEKQRLMNELGLSENVAQQAAKIATTLKLTDEQFALLVQRLKDLEGVKKPVEDLNESIESIGETIASSFESAFKGVMEGTKSVGQAFREMVGQIISELASQALKDAFKNLTPGGSSGSSSGIWNLIGSGFDALTSLIPGGDAKPTPLAKGGYASATRPYLVGEMGPEIMIPSASGRVVPNDEIGGSSGSSSGIWNLIGSGFDALTSLIPGGGAATSGNDVGGLIQPLAKGGYASATRPFLVGEEGPELMIPSASGRVVPNDELGGSGSQINQTFNVSTGVQQTVRAEIQSLMPQIAAASTQAVLNARRRGGSFAGAFT